MKILSVTPSTTTIVLDVTESKTLPIDVDDGGYSAPEGYYIASPSLSVDTVKIIGPKAIVETIEKTAQMFGTRNIQNKKGAISTFVVQVALRQKATWQGSVVCVETNEKKEFKSAMQLIRMIDFQNGIR